MYVPVGGKLGPWHREISSYQWEGELHRWIDTRRNRTQVNGIRSSSL